MTDQPESLPEAEYVTIDEAARRSSLSPNTIRNLIALGKIQYKHGLRRPGGNGPVSHSLAHVQGQLSRRERRVLG
jgi:hypothetical protein